jgi:tape measure domain-containing protein
VPSIDERVVAMSFENAVFEARVATTLATLGKLDTTIKNVGQTNGLENIEKAADKVTLNGPMSALDKLKAKLSGAGSGAAEGMSEIDRAGNKVTLEGPTQAVDKLQGKMGQLSAGTTFTDIEKAADRTTLEGLSRAIDTVGNKFSVLQGAASVALGGIASQAAMKGAAFAKSFAIGPIVDGFHEYSTNLSSIQTILANTQDSGGNLKTVNAALNELNTYSDKTIYNFSEMAKNIGTFTAAGVQLKPATAAIKGIANLAALSGSNSQQASTAMYQLSQAIAAGRVGLQDWNSVVNAGMGGAVFQKSLMRTAESMGALSKGAVKVDKATGKATVNGKSFRESIMAKPGEQSWLTSDVLTKTLSQFTGDLSDAQLAAQGFTADQIKAIQAQAKSAQNAATQVKTLPQVFDVARETIGSGWGKTFQLIFGDFGESKKTFTAMSNFINGFINTNAKARNAVLTVWSKLGGRGELLSGLKAAFGDLMAVVTPIKDAFRDIFPATTGKQLFEFTKNFTNLMREMRPSQQTIDNLQRTFRGLFAVLHIVWTVVKDVVGVIFDLIGVAGKGAGGFLNFTAGLGDFLTALDKAITSGNGLKSFFQGLGTILAVPLHLIGSLATAIGHLFGTDTRGAGKAFEDTVNGINTNLTPLQKLVKNVESAWSKLVDAFGRAKQALEPWFSQFVGTLSGVGKAIQDALSGISLDDVLKGIQTGLLAGLLITLKQAFGGGGKFLDSLRGPLDGVTKLLGSFTGQMEAMQSKLKAQALLAIAGAIAVLAAGIYVLSTINGEDLTRSMTAVAIGLGELMGAMKLMTSGMGKLGALQMPLIAAGLIGLATAVTILAGAMKIFATMSWEDLVKGMIGVAGSLTGVALAMKLMPPTLPLTAAGLVLIGLALNAIAAAMKQFGGMDLKSIAKGIFAMVEALAGIALGVSMMPPSLPLTAAGLILMGIALNSIGNAIKSIGSLDFATILKGLGGIMAAIAGIAGAMMLMPPSIGLQAAGLFILANALVVLGSAMKIIGGLSVGELIKSLVGIGGALLVIGAGLIFMEGTLAGAAALGVAAAALAILAPTLAFLGTLKWSTIFKGLGAIALALGTLAVVGALAAEPLAALGVALLPLAGVFILTAGGVLIFAKALSLLGDSGGKGIAVMITALTAFVAAIPTLVISFVKGLLSIVDQLAALAPKVVVALGVILDTIIAFVTTNAPKLAIAIGVLVDSIIQVVVTNAPKLMSAGLKLLLTLLDGISQNIGQVTIKGANIITTFLNALAAKAPDLVNAGANTLVAFIRGITNKIPIVVSTVTGMVTQFINALSRNIGRVVAAGQNLILNLVGAIAAFVPKMVTKGVDIVIGFLDGIEQAIPRIRKKALDVARTFLNNLADGLVGMADIAFKALIRFLNGFADAIRSNQKQLFDAGANVGSAILDGVIDGFGRMGGLVRKALEKVFDLLPGWAKKVLGIHSPSKVFQDIGMFTMQGFVKGVEDHAPEVKKSTEGIARSVPDLFRNILGIHSPSDVMRDIGQEVNRGFAQGLSGSQDDIRNAFQSMNDKLTGAMRDARQAIADNQKQLDEERAKSKPDYVAIKAAEDAIAQNENILRRTTAAHASLTGVLKANENQLLRQKDRYDAITKSLDNAQQKLDAITQARDQFQQSQLQKYDATPTLPGDDSQTKVSDYVKALQSQIVATQSYTDTLAKLRAMGLDDTTYQKLLDEGLAGKQFAEDLLRGGQSAITTVNTLDSQLLAAATTLSNNATSAMYDVGVKAAQALVDKITEKKKDLEKAMDDLGKAMIAALKRRLKIKSPSQVFQELGQLTMDGLAQGFTQGGDGASKVLAAAASTLVDTAKSTLAKVPGALDGIMDLDPTITPILDLSNVQNEAKKLDGLTNVIPITAAASFGQASAISADQAAAAASAAQAGDAGPKFEFNQYNTSPEALSEVEIYRQTKNQLAQVKSALGV